MIVVRTPQGVITSYREAWKDRSGQPVWTWRTDGPAPHDFQTVAAAQAWVDDYWRHASPKERAQAGWVITEKKEQL